MSREESQDGVERERRDSSEIRGGASNSAPKGKGVRTPSASTPTRLGI